MMAKQGNHIYIFIATMKIIIMKHKNNKFTMIILLPNKIVLKLMKHMLFKTVNIKHKHKILK